MSSPKESKKEQAKPLKAAPRKLAKILEEVRPPELAKEIKAAVKKAVDGELDGYPKLSRE